MANLASGTWRADSVVIVFVVQNDKNPSEDEWDAYVANVTAHLDTPNGAGLAFTDGGAPNSKQRDLMRETLGVRSPRSAVISDSVLVRGVVTALSWFNPNTIAFSPQRARDAFVFAGLEPEHLEDFWRAVCEADATLDPQTKIVREISQMLKL